MPKTDFDLDKFLGEVEVEAGEEEVLRKFFSRDKNKEFVLRQSDYDKQMNATKADFETKVQALAEKQETYDRLVTENLEYKGKTDKAVTEYKEKMERELKSVRAKAVKAAELAGMEMDEIEADDLLTPKSKGNGFDLEATRKELLKGVVTEDALNRLATGHINLTLELDEIKDAYEELNGKKLTRAQKDELLKEYGKDIGKNGQNWTLLQTADRLYEFSDKRSELEKGKLKKLVEDAEARGRQKAIQEMGDNGLPTPRRAGERTGSILFQDKTRKPTDPPIRDRGQKLALEALQKTRTA